MTRTPSSKSHLADFPIACNVLLIGETQAGKSTFVEAVRQYANLNHVIDRTRIGHGNVSFTTEVTCTRVETDLPSYEVTEDLEEYLQPEVINIDSLLDEKGDWEDYQERINRRRDLRLKHVAPDSSAVYHFNLFDTPGLNDTNGEDETHVNTIFRALRTLDQIHLVLVMVGPSAFTSGFRAALKCYIDVFPEFQGAIAFVHTKIDYADLHPDRKDFHSMFQEKKEILHTIMGRGSCQHFMINCDFESTKPIRANITLNTIRQILSLAPYNEPIAINKLSLHKTERMLVLDRIIINKYTAMIDAIVQTLGTKNVLQSSVLRQSYELKKLLNNLRAEKLEGEQFIAEHDTQNLVMIYENRFDEHWRLIHVNRPHSMAFPSQHLTIRKVMLLQEFTEISSEKGGKDHAFWTIDFKRASYKNGVLHAKLYTTSADKYRWAISTRKTRAVCLESEIPEAEDSLKRHNELYGSQQEDIDQLIKQNSLYTQMLSLARKDRLHPDIFAQMVDQRAYIGEVDENALSVERVYLQIVQ
ncbi:hypothetical protein EMPS_10464 [Entomortierella parvispora]|uniref:G domain-containing protein n=1 Tax=Entomortierella parvispora TaxID=205924 RepID=A0A9P3HJY6_9FUNG|nr:hypothetical protein EMPS_10464 [Entomortierella parvispora]